MEYWAAMDAPLLSVVVPVYNVREYLVACLESLAQQTYPHLEVVIVDDGSSDGSEQIADDFVAGREGWRVLHVSNGGLGRARNIGLDDTTGDYVAFVDSDDLVPRDAYALMMRAITGSGSDIVVGGVERFDGVRTWGSGLHQRAITGTRVGTHVRRTRSLLYDTTAWNKIFRRAFLREHGLHFPEGVYYEDIPVTIPAHVLAESVDVIAQPVYYWRVRQTGEMSITQRRAEVRNLVDRVAAVVSVDDFLTERGETEIKKAHDRKVLSLDLPLFIDVLHQADDEFYSELARLGRDVLERVTPGIVDGLSPTRRLQYHLIRHGMVDELKELTAYLRVPANRGKVVRRGVRLYADLPFLEDPSKGIPERVYETTRSQPLRSGLRDLHWEGDDLVIKGHAYIDQVAVRTPISNLRRIQLRKMGAAAADRTMLRSVPVRRPDITARTWGDDISYDGAGFRATLPTSLLQLGPEEQLAEWEVLAQVAAVSARRGSALGSPENGPARHIGGRLVAPGQLALVRYRGRKLRIGVERVRALLTGADIDGDDLVLRIGAVLGAALDGARLHLRALELGGGLTLPLTRDQDTLTARVPLDTLDVHAEHLLDRFWRFWLVVPAGGVELSDDEVNAAVTAAAGQEREGTDLPPVGVHHVRPLHLDPGVGQVTLPVRGRSIIVEQNPLRGARIRDTRAVPVIDDFRFEPDGLHLAGLRNGSSATQLDLVGQGLRYSIPLTADGTRWTAVLPADGEPDTAALRRLLHGKWWLRAPATDGGVDDVPVRAVPQVEIRMGQEGDYDAHRVLLRSNWAHHVNVMVDALGDWSFRGLRNRQRTMHRYYPVFRRMPMQDTILFASWKGRQFADSPRAIYEELVRRGDRRRKVWVTENHAIEMPEGVETVRTWSRDYFKYLARARWVVSNDAQISHYRKRPGSRYGQTWHGTPLKKIGFDIESPSLQNREYLEEFAREVAAWDALVSPNPFSSEIFSRAFRYVGPVLEIGYPRNDIFHRPEEAEVRAAEVRRRLALEEGKRIILYAPTWRDNVYAASGRYSFTMHLDLERLHHEFGDDSVLLIRGHQLLAANVNIATDGFVRNVSHYPDISDLYLVSDVLVTDYSSTMFDFANSGRPMLFFTYDLDDYRDDLRGFYFDFEAEAPGPLLRTSADLAEAMHDLPGVQARYAERYRAFQQRFVPLDDGQASARFVDRFLSD